MRKARLALALAFALGCSFSACVWTQESTAVLGTVVVTASKEGDREYWCPNLSAWIDRPTLDTQPGKYYELKYQWQF